MAHLKLKTPPTQDPVSVAEAKDYLRVDGNLEDTRIETMIKAATSRLEFYTDQKFISQVWIQYMDGFPMASKDEWWDGVKELAISELYGPQPWIELLTGPVRQIVAFNTYADDGVAQLFPSTSYIVDTSGSFGRIALPMGGVWPTTILRKFNGIQIEMQVGISANAAGVPYDIKQAVLETVSIMYENRGDEKPAIPKSSMMLLEPYVRHKAGGVRVGR
jgi:hypothetical protein